jgi:hypothetical protein
MAGWPGSKTTKEKVIIQKSQGSKVKGVWREFGWFELVFGDNVPLCMSHCCSKEVGG